MRGVRRHCGALTEGCQAAGWDGRRGVDWDTLIDSFAKAEGGEAPVAGGGQGRLRAGGTAAGRGVRELFLKRSEVALRVMSPSRVVVLLYGDEDSVQCGSSFVKHLPQGSGDELRWVSVGSAAHGREDQGVGGRVSGSAESGTNGGAHSLFGSGGVSWRVVSHEGGAPFSSDSYNIDLKGLLEEGVANAFCIAEDCHPTRTQGGGVLDGVEVGLVGEEA